MTAPGAAAMTNHVSQNVAVVPFLWVAPLALYLLSFVLTFGAARFYRRDVEDLPGPIRWSLVALRIATICARGTCGQAGPWAI